MRKDSKVFGRPDEVLQSQRQRKVFMVEDLMLRRKQKTEGLHKLVSHWEGPYMVKEVMRLMSYRLCTLDGSMFPTLGTLNTLGDSTLQSS